MNVSLNLNGKEDESNRLLVPERQQLHNVKKSDTKIQKIQGLRGISIFVVLFFHIRSDWFPYGHLGVDVFFAISGYLICHILSKEDYLNPPQILNFYFRRIKRILPIYLVVILVFIMTAPFLWLHPLFFNWFVELARQPLLFTANQMESINYFSINVVDYQFFVHLWSLSVEMQFYIVAPFFVIFLNRFSLKTRTFFVFSIATASFLYQYNSRLNVEHMALCSRIWQFMCGFLAYYLKGMLATERNNERNGNYSKLYNISGSFIQLGVEFLFIVFLNTDLTGQKSSHRLILLFLTTVCLASSNSSIILTNKPIVWLGDISYSVYLIHWFVFESHHYAYFHLYLCRRKASITVTVLLVSISIVLGFVVEKSYNRLNKYLNSWRSLLTFIFIAYLFISITLFNMDLIGAKETKFIRSSFRKHNHQRVDKTIMQIWNHNYNKVWTGQKSIQFNRALIKLRMDMFTCPNKAKKLPIPTDHDVKPMEITSTCYMKGKGHKNILILGNSHASTHFYGMEKLFKGIYANLTVVANFQCMFFELKQFRHLMTKKRFKTCEMFLKDLFLMLEKWDHRIDIIFVAHAYTPSTDPPISNITNDKLYLEMQSFYSKLSEFAAEVVIIPIGHVEMGVVPVRKTLYRQIHYNGNITVFRVPIEFQFNQWPNYKKRMRAIDCPNCIKIEWERYWCIEMLGFCDLIDFKRRLTFFGDRNHHTPYGSLVAADFVIKEYLSWQAAYKASHTVVFGKNK